MTAQSRRLKKLHQKLIELQRYKSDSLSYVIILPEWALDSDDDSHVGKWCCLAFVGRVDSSEDWRNLHMLPNRWFDTKSAAMKAAEEIEREYPAAKLKNGNVIEAFYVTMKGESDD